MDAQHHVGNETMCHHSMTPSSRTIWDVVSDEAEWSKMTRDPLRTEGRGELQPSMIGCNTSTGKDEQSSATPKRLSVPFDAMR